MVQQRERPSQKVVLRALKRTTKSVSDQPNTKLVYAQDPTFNVIMVYAYADFDTYRRLSKLLFRDPKPSDYPANGFAAFGPSVDSIDRSLCLVWVNNQQPLDETLPIFVHEIVHLSQDIMEHAGVQDRSGEVQAYTVEREVRRVMKELLGMKVPNISVTNKVEEILNGGCIKI